MKPHAPTVLEASLWSLGWVTLSCLFGLGVWMLMGADSGTRWFTAYVMEKSLSVDNLFVFSLIFGYFKIPVKFQNRCLLWGIIGVFMLRGCLLLAGVGAVQTFHWLTYVFGAILVWNGAKMLKQEEDKADIENELAVRIAKKIITYQPEKTLSGKFFVNSRATRLFVCLVAIELADVIFAVDSIPVVVSVTQNFFLALSSNIAAILGLRSLYFLLEHLLSRLQYLPLALSAVLIFIGAKMLAAPWVGITQTQSLVVVFGLIALATVLSIIKGNKK